MLSTYNVNEIYFKSWAHVGHGDYQSGGLAVKLGLRDELDNQILIQQYIFIDRTFHQCYEYPAIRPAWGASLEESGVCDI